MFSKKSFKNFSTYKKYIFFTIISNGRSFKINSLFFPILKIKNNEYILYPYKCACLYNKSIFPDGI